MKFESKSPDVHVAFVACLARRWGDNKPFKKQMAVRAIRERGGWRIDKTTAVASTWMPWEPVTTTVYRSLTAAKTELRNFARACKVDRPLEGARRRRRR